MKNLVVCETAQRFDKSDVVIHMLKHVDAQERVEVDSLVQHVRVDEVHALAFAASRQREGLLRHLIADERTFGKTSLELHEDFAGAAADFPDPRGVKVVAKDSWIFSAFHGECSTCHVGLLTRYSEFRWNPTLSGVFLAQHQS